MDCERLREEGAELALGVLPARERAEAVVHLDRCPDCRAHVERLTAVGDGLLGLLPGAEPPVGFETRVVRTMLPASAPSPSPAPGTSAVAGRWMRGRRVRGRRFRMAAAGVATALAFGFGGWAVGTVVESAPRVAAPSPHALEAALVSPDPAGNGREVGRIYAHPADATGGNGWVYMSVDLGDGPAADGPVRCLLVRADGSAVSLGSFPVRAGYGYWGAPAPAGLDPGTLSGARLVAADGTVLATARFAGVDGTGAGGTVTGPAGTVFVRGSAPG
ncbi:anti-sigma factor [Streptomyces sp. NK15101]|uniref:anti-sigma factor family protein n=1 Tax=Streptomyces sp. NK15101 TaxID=2873261 RepID=UPI001CED2DF1|nr:zf-HC2 domain-containing protein [Streptomyces sp. NK15101]